MRNVVVIGGGIAGLTAAYRLRRNPAGAPVPCTLIEAEARLGGKILTEKLEGFVLEGGPDSFVPHKPQALDLVQELGLEGRLLPSRDARRGNFIYHRGALQPVPDGLPMLMPRRWDELLRSPLLSWRGKLGFALERWRPPRQEAGDESVAAFVRRRLGDEVLERIAEPLLAHIHVADVERMSLESTYPRLAELERRFGSLRRGVRAGGVHARPGVPPRPLFWTLRGGLGTLIDALAGAGGDLIRGRRAIGLERSGGSYRVRLDDGRTLAAAAVVLATPAYAAAAVLEDFDRRLAGRLRSIGYVSVATLSFAYARREVRLPPAGFGFFVPCRAVDAVLACSFTSRKFEHQAPEENALLRVFVGGAHHQALLDLDDEALAEAVEEDLQKILGFRTAPDLRRLYRWPRGYPQYEVGHQERVRQIEVGLPPGLVFAGSGFHGVGLPDCIRSGTAAAEQVRRYLSCSG